jgi:hypothetical protein
MVYDKLLFHERYCVDNELNQEQKEITWTFKTNNIHECVQIVCLSVVMDG